MEPMMEHIDLTTPEARVASYERIHDATLSDDVTERFRAISAQGIMNAIERVLELPSDKQGEAIVGICQGMANSLASMLSFTPADVHLGTMAVLLICVEHVIARHPALAAVGPKVTAAFRKILDDWEVQLGERGDRDLADADVV